MTWAERVAYALVGTLLPMAETGPAPGLIVTELERHGWGRERIAQHVEELRAHGLPWPGPVPPQWVREAGPAQWQAVMSETLRLLSVDDRGPVRARVALTADDRRLLADRPPHW